MARPYRVSGKSIAICGPYENLTLQIAIDHFDLHGVVHPVMRLADLLSILVEACIDGLDSSLGTKEGEVDDDFANLFCACQARRAHSVSRERVVAKRKGFLVNLPAFLGCFSR